MWWDLLHGLRGMQKQVHCKRFLCGLSIGVSSVLTNLYITEASLPSHSADFGSLGTPESPLQVSPAVCRGRLGGWAPFIGTSGILVSYIVQLGEDSGPDSGAGS